MNWLRFVDILLRNIFLNAGQLAISTAVLFAFTGDLFQDNWQSKLLYCMYAFINAAHLTIEFIIAYKKRDEHEIFP